MEDSSCASKTFEAGRCEGMKSIKGMLTTGAVTLILAFASGALAQAADLRSEVEARYGRELLSTFEQMQSGIREPEIQSAPEASEPEALWFRNDVSKSLDETRQIRLRTGLDAAQKEFHDWASGPTGARIKEDLPLRLPAGE
jgi:hypothetical protein